jgi:hypothetical protein
MKVEIIRNPWREVFVELVRTSEEQLLASPFVKANVAEMVLENRPEGARISLLTSFKLTNFYRSSSDVAALRSFVRGGVGVRNYPRLHAKTYIFDRRRALVTSANLTLGGLEKNYECGVLIEDGETASKLGSEFREMFEDKERASTVTEEVLWTTEEILGKVPKEKKLKFEKSERELFESVRYEPEDDLYDGGVESITESLSGWRLDTFDAVSRIRANVFRLDEVYAYKSELQRRHPENRNIEAKLRQQLQELRDLGLIEFLGSGVYRKLWKSG